MTKPMDAPNLASAGVEAPASGRGVWYHDSTYHLVIKDSAGNNYQHVLQSELSAAVANLWVDQGSYNASSNTFPTSANTVLGDNPKRGYIWTISSGGTLGGVAVAAGDTVRALIDNPGQTAANWAQAENNFGFTPLNQQSNLSDVASATTSATNLGLGAASNVTFGTVTTGKLTINSSQNSQIDLDGAYVDGVGTGVGLDMFLLSTSTANGTHSPNAARSVLRADVRSGITNSGTMIAHRYILRRNDVATDEGALSTLTCLMAEYGHSNTAVITPTTTTVHGLDMQPLMRTGSITTFYDVRIRAKVGSVTPTTYWGLSHEDTTANHQLVGRLALGQTLGTAPTAILDLGASTTARASLRIRSGTAPSSPNSGDVWYNGTDVVINESISVAGVTSTAVMTQNSLSVGYLEIPQNAQTGNYTAVLADSGKHIFHNSGDGAGDTYTIPANASVAYPLGTTLTFVNRDANTVSIAITSDTMYLGGTTTTGSRTLAENGVATAIKVASTVWIISGSGLT